MKKYIKKQLNDSSLELNNKIHRIINLHEKYNRLNYWLTSGIAYNSNEETIDTAISEMRKLAKSINNILEDKND